MAKDPSKKGVRKIPQQFLDWISETYSPELATWYKTTTGKSKALASKQRVDMSAAVKSVGAFHEGHYQGAKDFDVKSQMGGGPTTGRTLRPEIGVINVAHAEMPRISKADMKRLGIPQYWLEDFYEAILESEGMKVLGNPDVQAALDMDRGMSAEQAAAQSRLREDLRRQGAPIPGDRLVYRKNLPPLEKLPAEQVVPPEFDISEIKTTGEIKVKPRTSRIPKVPQNPYIDFTGGNARLTRKALTGLAAAGLAAPAFLGTAASSAELAGRAQVAKETGDPADQFQAGLAGASLAGDVVSYFPPAAPIGEAVSTAADVANIGIDVYREDPKRAKRMVKQQVQRVIPSDPVVRPVQRAVQAVQRGGRVKFGFGGATFTLPEFGLSELLRFN